MLNKEKKITVVMSVYNHEEHVGFAIESVINQTHKNLEFIIINDGSKDSSLRVIKKYKKLDSRIIVVDQDNIGLTKSLNVGIKLSTGDYIARQDADDRSSLNRLEKQLEIVKKFDLDIITSSAFNNKKVVPNELIFKFNHLNLLRTGNVFIHGTFLISKSVFEKQIYNERYQYAQDFKFILDAVSNNFKIGTILDPLYHLGNIGTSISNTKNKEQTQCAIMALGDTFGEDRPFRFINMFNRRLKIVARLCLLIFLSKKNESYEFKIIRKA